jgi:hypothetical protein
MNRTELSDLVQHDRIAPRLRIRNSFITAVRVEHGRVRLFQEASLKPDLRESVCIRFVIKM